MAKPIVSGSFAKIAALGYYGFGNLGDEAVLAGIREALAVPFPAAELLVLSNAPAETMRLHPGTRAVDRWGLRDLPSALRGTNLFIFGGGSLLQDATSVKSVVWYAVAATLARRRARRVLWWAQGVGPLRKRVSRLLVRFIGNQADAITVRDEKSRELLKAVGVRGSISLVADPAFALSPVPPSKPTQTLPPVLLALRSWSGGDISRESLWELREMLTKRDEMLTLGGGIGQIDPQHSIMGMVPMHLPDDARFMRDRWGDNNSGNENGRDMPLLNWQEEGHTPAQVLGVVAQARLMVAMRLHALIFAARCGVPFVALSYDPKVDALALACGQKDALLPLANVTADTLRAVAERVLDTWQVRHAALSAWAELQRERANEPARIAAQLM